MESSYSDRLATRDETIYKGLSFLDKYPMGSRFDAPAEVERPAPLSGMSVSQRLRGVGRQTAAGSGWQDSLGQRPSSYLEGGSSLRLLEKSASTGGYGQSHERLPTSSSIFARPERPSFMQESLSSRLVADRPGLTKDHMSASAPASSSSLGRSGLFDFATSGVREGLRSESGNLYGTSRYGTRSLFSDLEDRLKPTVSAPRATDTSSLSGTSVSRGGYTGIGLGLSSHLNNVDRASSIPDELRSLSSLTSGLNSALYNLDRPSARAEEPQNILSGGSQQVSAYDVGLQGAPPYNQTSGQFWQSRQPDRDLAPQGDKEPWKQRASEAVEFPSLKIHTDGPNTSPGLTKSTYEFSGSARDTARSPIDEGPATSTSGSPSPGNPMYQNLLDKLAENHVEEKPSSFNWDVSITQGGALETEHPQQVSDLFPPENYITPRPTNAIISPTYSTFEMEAPQIADVDKTFPHAAFQYPTDGADLAISRPLSIYIGQLVQITPDATCLEEHVKACGMSWPSGPTGKHWTWKLAKTGFVEEVDFDDFTVYLSSDLNWTPLRSLMGFHDLSEEQIQQLKLDFLAKTAPIKHEVQNLDRQTWTPEKKSNPELERRRAEAAPANWVYCADCTKLVCKGGRQLEKIQGLPFCRTKDLNDPVGVDSLQVVGWQTCVAGVDEGDDWLKVGDHYLPMKLAGVPVLSPAVYMLDNSGLKAKTRGLAYRSTKNLADKVGAHAIAMWGTLVHGEVVSDAAGAQWLRIGERFLPFSLNDVKVLIRSPVAGPGVQQEFGLYEIVVDNTNGSRLGLELDSQDDGSLLVRRIYGGLVLEWNCHHPDCMVAVGDSITWVDDDDPDRDTRTSLLAKIQRKRRMTLRLECGST